MRRSDIFESFVKIAEEKGLVSREPVKKQAEAEHTEKNLDNPRWDSLSAEDIAHLYGVKPPSPKEMQYKSNIMEVAHPDPLVIAPSYDKLNGLVENEIERQNIDLRIALKPSPDGQLTNRKYAKQNLILSLVRVGNEMDARGEDALTKLADACLLQASQKKSLEKAAQLQMMVPLIAATLGGIYAKQHLRFHSDGFRRDYEKAIAELDDLINSNSNWGVGYEYTPQLIEKANDIKNKLNELNTAYEAVVPELDKLEEPHTGPQLAQIAKQPDTHEALHALQEFRKVVEDVYPYLYQVVRDFTNEGYKQRQIANKGWLTGVVDSAEVLHGGKGLVADDFDDVAHALQTLFYDISNIEKSLAGADSMAAAATQQLSAAKATMPGADEVPAEGAPVEEAPSAPVPPSFLGELAGPLAAPTGPVGESQVSQLERELAEFPDLT